MDYALAADLVAMLRAACPYRTGALRASISRVQGTEKEYIITIGDESGKEINGQCATKEYAAYTNFNESLTIRKRDPESKAVRKIQIPNRNYHWVNKTIERWIQKHKLDFTLNSESEDENELDIR